MIFIILYLFSDYLTSDSHSNVAKVGSGFILCAIYKRANRDSDNLNFPRVTCEKTMLDLQPVFGARGYSRQHALRQITAPVVDQRQGTMLAG